MPLPLIAAALPTIISAGAGLASQGLNTLSTGLANKKAYKRAQSMRDYDNTYNSPAEQMKRLKAAGLNPNMVYGGGNTSIASSGKTPTPEAPQFDLQGIVHESINAMKTMAETDNLRELNEQLKIRNQGFNIENVMKDLKITEQDRKNRMQQGFLDTTLEGLKYKNALTQQQTQYGIDENMRRAALSAQSLKEGALRVLQMQLQQAKTIAETDQIRAAIDKVKADTKLVNYENTLNENFVGKGSREWLDVILNVVKTAKYILKK